MRATFRPGVAGVLLATLGLSLLSACGGDSSSGEDPAAAISTPACMKGLSKVDIPSDGSFPKDWPLPPGTVVTETQQVPGGSGLAITAQVAADFEKVLPFMQHDLEDAGYVASQGEAEHDDAEAVWSGNGYAGTWAIRASDDCEGTTLLQVAAAKQ